MNTLKKRIEKLEKSGQPDTKINIIWLEEGEKYEPEPGTLVIYWGAGDDIGSYRYDPTKPNGGRPAAKKQRYGGQNYGQTTTETNQAH